MKQLLILLSFVISFASCSKDKDATRTQEPPEGSKIEFKIDGNLKQYFTTNAGVAHVTGVNVYTFIGTKNPTNDNYFSITFMTDSLRPGTYSLNTGVVSFREGSVVATNISSTDFMVTVISNVNGLVNGTFKGTVFDQTGNKNSIILEGLIQNIQLNY